MAQAAQLSSVLCDNLDGIGGWSGEEVQEGGDIYVHIADTLYGTAETNTIFQSNYTSTKQRKNKKL